MKLRLLAIGVLTLLLLLPAGCAKNAPDAATLQEKGLAMVERMDELASSKAYVDAMSASSELGEIIAAMGAGDYATPKAVYRISVPAEAVREAVFGGESSGLSDELTAWVAHKACTTIPTQMAARSGASMLAAVSCVTYGQAVRCEGLDEPALYLYQYGGDYGAMVSFLPGEDGAASGTAYFIPMDDAGKAAASAEAVSAWINDALGFLQITTEKVG